MSLFCQDVPRAISPTSSMLDMQVTVVMLECTVSKHIITVEQNHAMTLGDCFTEIISL